MGGLMAFGVGTFLDFCVFLLPLLAFPVALVGCFNARLAAVLWALLMALFFGAQVYLAWPLAAGIRQNGTHFILFLTVEVLLCLAVRIRRAK